MPKEPLRCSHDGGFCHHLCPDSGPNCFRREEGCALTTPHQGWPKGDGHVHIMYTVYCAGCAEARASTATDSVGRTYAQAWRDLGWHQIWRGRFKLWYCPTCAPKEPPGDRGAEYKATFRQAIEDDKKHRAP